MDLVYALLIALGARHAAPAYHTPVKTIPLITHDQPGVLHAEHWGAPCSR